MPNTSNKLYTLALFLAGCVFFLLLAGGLVTSHEAGLAVPDWPLSYGSFFPPMVGNIFWEHGHRMIAGFVALLTVFTAVRIQVSAVAAGLKKLAWAAVGMVFLQALLGGLTVLLLLPPAVSIAHACLGQTFFCVVLALAWYLGPAASREEAAPAPETQGLRRLARMTFIMLYVQLILGATVRHTGHAIAFHVLVAVGVVSHVLMLSSRIQQSRDFEFLQKPALIMGGLVLVQIFLGIGSFVFKFMLEQSYAPSAGRVAFTVTHQTLGALLLGFGALAAVAVHPKPAFLRAPQKAAA